MENGLPDRFVAGDKVEDTSGLMTSNTAVSLGGTESFTGDTATVGAVTEAALALARAAAKRSAVRASAFLRWSIRVSSSLIFLTKSLISPGLEFQRQNDQHFPLNNDHRLNWKGFCKSRRSLKPIVQISVNDSDPKLHFHSSENSSHLPPSPSLSLPLD